MSTTPVCARAAPAAPPHIRAALAIAAALLTVHVVTLARMPGRAAQPRAALLDLQLRLDPNTATAHELALLPGIGPHLAENILAYRAAVAPPAFRAPADLERVPRIGPVTAERLRPYLRFPPAPAAPTGEPLPVDGLAAPR